MPTYATQSFHNEEEGKRTLCEKLHVRLFRIVLFRELQQQGSTDLIFRRFFLISLRNVCEHFKWYFLQNRFNIGRFFCLSVCD